jgi:hypothetical protein
VTWACRLYRAEEFPIRYNWLGSSLSNDKRVCSSSVLCMNPNSHRRKPWQKLGHQIVSVAETGLRAASSPDDDSRAGSQVYPVNCPTRLQPCPHSQELEIFSRYESCRRRLSYHDKSEFG